MGSRYLRLGPSEENPETGIKELKTFGEVISENTRGE